MALTSEAVREPLLSKGSVIVVYIKASYLSLESFLLSSTSSLTTNYLQFAAPESNQPYPGLPHYHKPSCVPSPRHFSSPSSCPSSSPTRSKSVIRHRHGQSASLCSTAMDATSLNGSLASRMCVPRLSHRWLPGCALLTHHRMPFQTS